MTSFWATVQTYLSIEIFSYQDKTFTLGDILLVPTYVVIAIVIIRWCIRFIEKRMRKSSLRPDLVLLISRLLYIIAIVVVTVTTLELINVPLTAFAFVSGAVAIGVGFGAQNIINNFISGWILMWERPIRIGDFLEIDGIAKGTVETIKTRSTRIRRTDGVHLLIPNSKLLENTVVNWTLIDNNIRTSVKVGVAYGSPAKKVQELIMQAVKAQDEILSTPGPTCIFDDFGDNALVFEVYFWVRATIERDIRIIRSNVRFSIDELFAQHNIVIAFPQRDIHVDGKLTINNAKNDS